MILRRLSHLGSVFIFFACQRLLKGYNGTRGLFKTPGCDTNTSLGFNVDLLGSTTPYSTDPSTDRNHDSFIKVFCEKLLFTANQTVSYAHQQ
jgi:hypothetical protein